MKKTHFALATAAAAILLSGCGQKKTEPVALFNGKDLTGWTLHLQDSSKNAAEEFVVRDGVISLSGSFGYIRTAIPYANYKLSAEWRWPDSATNSGIFVNIAEDGIWPSCYECQLWTGRAGDVINSGGAMSDEYRNDSTLMIVPKMHPSNEKPQGEWNSAEIVSSDSTLAVYINGELQNKLSGLSNRQGYIGLQSEGGPIQFRNVTISPLE